MTDTDWAAVISWASIGISALAIVVSAHAMVWSAAGAWYRKRLTMLDLWRVGHPPPDCWPPPKPWYVRYADWLP